MFVVASFVARSSPPPACSVVAVDDVVNKALLEPIRPHFAIASVFRFDLEEAHQLPLKYGWINEAFDRSAKGGIMLTIGFVPGLKLQPISLLQQILTSQDSQGFMIFSVSMNLKQAWMLLWKKWFLHTNGSSRNINAAPVALLSELSDTVDIDCFYIGVTKRRKCSFGWTTSLAFYEVSSSLFLDNFPGVTLGMTFNGRVFGRGDLTPDCKGHQKRKRATKLVVKSVNQAIVTTVTDRQD
ncbi:hypothetical protein L1987_64455 [Smallanthus sonchifolius]|uniref:Uncharacterized protein n=1 Tax=Smallanthus sonchifolius TaxID=185202 RepID=A0ACB9CGB7_9ASTR|nr:hypothetical protein L1987_64455 [Smallanthus sonchifolius]